MSTFYLALALPYILGLPAFRMMPIDLIKRKAVDAEENDFGYGNLMIYPTAVKKSYTLDLPAKNGRYPPTKNGDIRSLF